MITSMTLEETSLSGASPWLTIDTTGEDAVLVTATGGIAAHRALDLWATVEEALECAAGRLVAVDLLAVSTFDVGSVDALIRLARASARRHAHLCALTEPNSPLHQYVQWRQPIGSLSVYRSLPEALAALEGRPSLRVIA